MGLTYLKGIRDISESTLCDQLEANLIEYFNWGLLGIGAFFNVRITDDESQLRITEDPLFVKGRVWEPFRNDIVWESGVLYGLQPIGISGVYVNGTFRPTSSSGTYAHYVDYARGRVVFNTALPANSEVKMEYTYRYFHWTSADVPWFRQLMFDSLRVDNNQFLQYGSGAYAILGQNRVQLPAVVVEVIPRRVMEGYQIGGGQKVKQDILFHIFTENPWDRKTLLDVITYQNNETIYTFDKNLIAQQERFAFTETGALASGALTYPRLIAPTGEGGFYWKKLTFEKISTQESINMPPLFQGVVRGTFEIVLPEI